MSHLNYLSDHQSAKLKKIFEGLTDKIDWKECDDACRQVSLADFFGHAIREPTCHHEGVSAASPSSRQLVVCRYNIM